MFNIGHIEKDLREFQTDMIGRLDAIVERLDKLIELNSDE